MKHGQGSGSRSHTSVPRWRSRAALTGLVAATVVLAAMAGRPARRDDCPNDGYGNIYAPEHMTQGAGCGDIDQNGTVDWRDVVALWYASKQCPNWPEIETPTPEMIIGNANLIKQICQLENTALCWQIWAGAAVIFQDEIGRMPTPAELEGLDGNNGGSGPCSSPGMPEAPMGPLYPCESPDPEDCGIILQPGQNCTTPTCEDIVICRSGDCQNDPLPEPEEIESVQPIGDMYPFGFPPTPDEGDGPTKLFEWIWPVQEEVPLEPPQPKGDMHLNLLPPAETEPVPVPYSEFVVAGTATAPSESGADDDDQPAADDKGGSCGSNSGGGQGGAQAQTPAPVTVAWGHKSEQATDVVVRLTGRDFRITRSYTSFTNVQGAHPVGNNWTLSVFNGLYPQGSGSTIHVYSPHINRVVPFVASGNVWVAQGPSRQVLSKELLGSGGPPVYRLTEPGAGSRYYYRVSEGSEPQHTPALVGLLAKETDTFENKAEYVYEIFGSGAGQAARVRKVILNGGGATPEAEVRFQWYLEIGGNPQDYTIHGKLARIQVIRFDGTTEEETDRVEYTYKNNIDPFPSALGTNGDLIQVARFNRVDDWVSDGNTHSPGYPHRVFVTQYRYHDGNTHSNSDPRLAVAGATRQLKSVFMPEQIEYYAQQLHRTDVLQYPSVAVRDAAYRLMLRADGALAFADEATIPNRYKVVDLAAKIIDYDTAGRVETQYLQSSCGCAGGVSQGLRQTFSYADWSANTLWPFGGRATKVEEHYFNPSSGTYSDLHRTLFYDMATQVSGNEVPYLVNSVIKDSAGQFWITHYKYDSNRRVVQKYTPAAMSQSYTPAAGTTAPSYSTGSSGLIFVYDYTSDHRVKEMGLKNGASGTVELLTRVTYPTADGSNVRTYLPSKVERFSEAGTSDENKIQTTWFEYRFHGDATTSSKLAVRRIIAERERRAENGPETSDSGVTLFTPPGGSSTAVADSYELFDDKGRLCWVRHADQSLTQRVTASGSPRPTEITLNADATGLSMWSSLVSTTGWGNDPLTGQRLSGGSLSWEYEYDSQGRIHIIRGPGGVERTFKREYRPLDLDDVVERPGVYYFVKRELPHQLTSSPNTYAGPATLNWFNAGGRVVSSAQFTLDSSGILSDSPVARRTLRYSLAGQLERERVWHDIAGDLSYDTTYTYDAMGRRATVTYPNRTVLSYDSYDALGRVLTIGMGKIGTSTATIVSYFYDDPDGDSTPEQGVGNGNLSWTVRPAGESRTSGDPGGGTSSELRTFRVFDFRNRLKVVQGPEAPHFAAEYDNLGRPTEVGLFTSVPTSISSSGRGVYVKYGYSQRGLRYQTLLAVNPASPTDYLGTYSWLDPVGRRIARWEPNSHREKVTFDGLGRPAIEYATDGANDPAPGATNNHAAARSVTDDIVLEQVVHRYDSNGRPDLVTARVRLHDAGTAAGTLTNSTSVVTYDAAYFDSANRPIRSVQIGTNQAEFQPGGTQPTWPPSSPPNWNDSGWEDRLISAIEYDARGYPHIAIDPEGKRTKTGFDAMGRAAWVVENENNSTVSWSSSLERWTVSGMSGTDGSLNRATSFTYGFDSSSNYIVKEYAHKLVSSAESVEVTQYEYGTSSGSSSNDLDSLVNSGHLLARVRQPDPTTGAPGGDSQSMFYAYDRQGEMRAFKDQNGTIHRFDRDMLDRVIKDRVTSFGAEVNDRVDSIANRFDRLDRLDQVVSYDGTTAVNAVELVYNTLGQILKVYQDADGVVQTSGGNTALVEYTQSTSASGNYARISTLAYPASATVSYSYGSSGDVDSRISRIKAATLNNLAPSISSLVSYDYLGLGFPVGVDLPLVDVQLDRTFTPDGKRSIRGHTSQTSGLYGGWDRFGRIKRQAWVDGVLSWPGSGATLPDRPPIIQEEHAYDRVGNRAASYDRRPNAERPDRDLEHFYDGLHRVKESKRGKRTTSWADGKGSQAWELDQLGNWDKVKTDADGNGVYTDDFETEQRGHNAINQLITQQLLAQSTQPVRPLAYDNAGNLKEHEKSSTITMKYTHDAWGRLVKVVRDLGSVDEDVAEYEYNGLHWRTVKRVRVGDVSTLNQQRKLYYSAAWQLIQEDIDDNYASSPGTNRYVQHFWGLRYVDDILMHRTFETPQPPNPSGEDPSWWGGVHSYFHLTDVQFSTVAILDEAGRLLERTRYTTYGQGLHRWPGDFDGNGYVDDDDAEAIGTTAGIEPVIGDTAYDPDMDLNRDGRVDKDDNSLFGTWSGRGPLAAGLISDPDGPDNTIGYSGYLFNPEVLIYTVRHRHYEPMLGRFMEQDWLGYVDGMNMYEYVRGMATIALDPFGLRSDRTGRSREQMLNDANRNYCKSIKDRRDQGKMCQDQFEQQWTNHHCGELGFDVTSAESSAYWNGFWQGAHDGYIQTAYSTLDAWTLGLLDLDDYPTDMGWLHDPDNPYLKYSRYAGNVVAAALPVGGIGSSILKNSRIVIGETAARVRWAGFLRNASTYKPGQFISEAASLNKNADWLMNALRSGKRVIDIGLDPRRTTPGIYYFMERTVLEAWRRGLISQGKRYDNKSEDGRGDWRNGSSRHLSGQSCAA